jgi:hypothetical protein
VLNRDQIQIASIKLAGGDRLLRLTEPVSGFALEKKLDVAVPVVQQKEQLFRMFEAALQTAAKDAA